MSSLTQHSHLSIVFVRFYLGSSLGSWEVTVERTRVLGWEVRARTE